LVPDAGATAVASPENCAGRKLWLDRQLAGRLTSYFRCAFADLPGGFGEALRIWQWERLGETLSRASVGSFYYRTLTGGREGARKLLERAAAHAGLAPTAVLFSRNTEYPGGGGIVEQRFAPTGPMPLRPGQSAAAARALLDSLPLTSPDRLAAAPETFLAVGHSEVRGVISLPTSGTTGSGKRIFCSGGDLARTAAFFACGMQYMVQPGQGDHVALLMSGDRPGSVGDLLLRGMRMLGVPCSVPGFVRPGAAGETEMLKKLAVLRPTCLVGVPAQVLGLARHSGVRELTPFTRTVLLSGDAVTSPLREGIAEGFGCEVFVHYGLTETGLGGAVECEEHAGCHMREADMLYEITDENGRALSAGNTGEIVITTLTREAMPLLRYRTGDEGVILPGECPCGSVFGRLHVLGRMARRLRLPDGALLRLSDLDGALYALPFVHDYSATWHEPGEGSGPEGCLVLTLRIAEVAAADAGATAEMAIAALPGLGVIRRPEDIAGTGAAMPVLVRLEAEGASGEAARRGAKRIIHRVREPVFAVAAR
jgi:phenylacetate-coenzyme A ligase PaaK-like adenylate-forming protein